MMSMTGSSVTSTAPLNTTTEGDQVTQIPSQPLPATSSGTQQLLVEAAPARRVGEAFFPEAFIDELIASATNEGVALTGRGGMLPELVRSVLERRWPSN